jgi:hypothetical protein
MRQYMQTNNNVWVAETLWAASPWWDDHIYTREPKAGADCPHMSWLTFFFVLK